MVNKIYFHWIFFMMINSSFFILYSFLLLFSCAYIFDFGYFGYFLYFQLWHTMFIIHRCVTNNIRQRCHYGAAKVRQHTNINFDFSFEEIVDKQLIIAYLRGKSPHKICYRGKNAAEKCPRGEPVSI